jgi:hypothetical protein
MQFFIVTLFFNALMRQDSVFGKFIMKSCAEFEEAPLSLENSLFQDSQPTQKSESKPQATFLTKLYVLLECPKNHR